MQEPPSRPSRLWDSPERYGVVSRLLHWLMAPLFAWMLISALFRVSGSEAALARFFWSTHYSVGFCILLLVLVRALWGLLNLGSRPAYGGGPVAWAARAGHLALYGLMIAIPTLGTLRAYGGGRGLRVFGVEVLAATGERVPALMAPANAVHGLLGWTLFALILGHVLMVLVHRHVWRQDVLARMLGGRRVTSS